ncbi:MAG: hypothetical protein ACK4NP_09135 [Parvularculaceae bacterium]
MTGKIRFPAQAERIARVSAPTVASIAAFIAAFIAGAATIVSAAHPSSALRAVDAQVVITSQAPSMLAAIVGAALRPRGAALGAALRPIAPPCL